MHVVLYNRFRENTHWIHVTFLFSHGTVSYRFSGGKRYNSVAPCHGVSTCLCSFIYCCRVCVVNLSSVITSWGEAAVGGLAFSILVTYIMYAIISFLLLLVTLEGCDLCLWLFLCISHAYLLLFLWYVTFDFLICKFGFVKFDFRMNL